MNVLDVSHLTKRFKNFTAVNDISFQLKEGEILGLLGPNGAGKTTTIQMLLGVLSPTSGHISYFGKNFKTHREEILDKVNFSTTYTNLPWNLSVRENLTYTIYLYDIPDRKKRLEEIISIFRLSEIIDQTLSELSAGQLTRVNLAKAFLNEPKVLLLDEPTASLDPEIASFIRSFIISQRDEKKLSIIFTSHNMTEVEEVCNRILFINNGKIVADDTPENLVKTIDLNKIRLVIDIKKDKLLTDFCNKNKYKIVYEERHHCIEMPEKEIPLLLSFLNEHKIHIMEITIDKPDLEDYFLQIAKENQNRES